MPSEAPGLDALSALRLLYNLPPTVGVADRRANAVLDAADRLPLKVQFSPDRIDPLPKVTSP